MRKSSWKGSWTANENIKKPQGSFSALLRLLLMAELKEIDVCPQGVILAGLFHEAPVPVLNQAESLIIPQSEGAGGNRAEMQMVRFPLQPFRGSKSDPGMRLRKHLKLPVDGTIVFSRHIKI